MRFKYKDMFKKALSIWFPRPCVLCTFDTLDLSQGLCSLCQKRIAKPQYPCPCCATERIMESLPCSLCYSMESPISQTIVLGNYVWPLDTWIIRLKHHHQLSFGRLLGECLSQEVIASLGTVDYLVPMPLHLRRLRERGFNQALELARPIAKKLNIPILLKGVRRNRETLTQASLSAKDRLSNLKDAFVVDRSLKGLSIAIIDDVVTTGATSRALAEVLREAGAADVQLWCVAKAQPRSLIPQASMLDHK